MQVTQQQLVWKTTPAAKGSKQEGSLSNPTFCLIKKHQTAATCIAMGWDAGWNRCKPQSPTSYLCDLGEITSLLWTCFFSYILTLQVSWGVKN